ncbi:MAG: FKBP-type peptidyl-prolyl cis-trans isomerase [Bdellovibrionales bacterium]|nr:FKBP-type peptidyl-prolyl cis-trans isomerase [Bdellovibrionales bacterium]
MNVRRRTIIYYLLAGFLLIQTGCVRSCSWQGFNRSPQSLKKPLIVPNYSEITVQRVVRQDLVPGALKSPSIGLKDKISIKYQEWIYSPKEKDNQGPIISENLDPLIITVGSGELLKEVEKGLVGMKVGGKRRFIIPSSLAYGESGSLLKSIPAKAIIMVDVEVLSTLKR